MSVTRASSRVGAATGFRDGHAPQGWGAHERAGGARLEFGEGRQPSGSLYHEARHSMAAMGSMGSVNSRYRHNLHDRPRC